jgi:hypothetical protein
MRVTALSLTCFFLLSRPVKPDPLVCAGMMATLGCRTEPYPATYFIYGLPRRAVPSSPSNPLSACGKLLK